MSTIHFPIRRILTLLSMNKVLLITIPSTSLYSKKAFLDINMGTAFVGGGLEAQGFDVHFYDFNMALNRLREPDFIGTRDNNVLQDLSKLICKLESGWFEQSSVLSRWIEDLLNEIEDQDFKYIGLSLDRIGYSSIYSKGALHFSILLAQALKEKFSLPLFLGGRQCINQVGMKYFTELQEALGDLNPIDIYFSKDGHTSFPEVLKMLDDGATIGSEAIQNAVEQRSLFSKMSQILPKYDLVNHQDSHISMENIFPGNFLEKNPQVANFAPIFVVPYKFSVGCPFTCSFCTDGLQRYHAAFNPEEIVNTLLQLQNRGLRYFRFYNNNINLSRKFIGDFHKAATAANLNIMYSDSANFRIFNPEIAKEIRETGCVKLWYGAETVSEKIQEMIHKKVSLKRIKAHLQTANDLNIWNSLNFIFNFPHETDEDFDALIEFLSDRDLVDTFYRNEFLLLHETDYAVNPEKFNIKIRDITNNGLLGSFDEIDGRPWEILQKLGQDKQNQIDEILPFEKNMLLANDQILFVLHEVYKDKNIIRQKFNDIFDSFDDAKEFYDYAYGRSWRIPAEMDGQVVTTEEVRHNEVGGGTTGFAQVISQM